MSKPRVTICPPAEQEVFFQETQFDKSIARHKSGPAPVNQADIIWKGNQPISDATKERRAREGNQGLVRLKKKRIATAEEALANHPNKDAIMKILRSE